MDEDEDKRKKLVIFGKDLAAVPCFRNSFLCGFGSGIGGGLVYFLYSSRVQSSVHASVLTFMAATMGYWGYCRYNYAVTKFQLAQIKAGMQQRALHEGTALQKEIEEKLDLKSA